MTMHDWERKTPVAMVVFNRPETTSRVFAEVARARPKQLFVIADGARMNRSEEADKCAHVRKIVQAVDWPCELTVNFSEENLGCKRRLATGLTWLFDQTEAAIILEDDCVPHPTFFRFADELLERYRDEPRVAQVCGVNFNGGHRVDADSFYFSRYPHIWGWASWRRAWKHYDVAMQAWPGLRETPWLSQLLGSERQAAYWTTRFDKVYSGQLDTWDYQWTFACWKNSMMSAIPRSNLISNVGFGADATHTKRKGSSLENMPAEGIEFPLLAPKIISTNQDEDNHTDRMFFSGSRTLRGLVRRAVGWLKGLA